MNDCDKCKAKRINGERCSRRHKDGFEYCGTHIKGTPYGIVGEDEEKMGQQVVRTELYGKDDCGIITYIVQKKDK